MATIDLYLTTSVDAQNWVALATTTQAAATTASGWTVSTGATNHSELESGVERAASTFAGTGPPDGSLDSTLGDAMRSPNALTGDFAAGDWVCHFVVRAVTNGGAQDGRVRFRIFKANADGTGATEITAAQQLGSIVTDVSTAADFDSTLTVNLGAFSVANQYIFFQIAWERTGAGGMSNSDVLFRTGSSTSAGTRISTPAFTTTVEAADSGAVVASEVEVAPRSITDAAESGAVIATEFAEATASAVVEVDTTESGKVAASEVEDRLLVSIAPQESSRAGLTEEATAVSQTDAAESGTVAATEADPRPPLSFVTPSETGAVVASETAPFLVTIDPQESSRAGLSEEATVVARTDAAETGVVVASDDVGLPVPALSTAETGAVVAVEAEDRLSVTINPVDTWVAGLTDVTDLLARLTPSETALLGLTDEAAAQARIDGADAQDAVGISEGAQETLPALSDAESGRVALAEVTGAISVTLAPTVAWPVVQLDDVILFVTLEALESLRIIGDGGAGAEEGGGGAPAGSGSWTAVDSTSHKPQYMFYGGPQQ